MYEIAYMYEKFSLSNLKPVDALSLQRQQTVLNFHKKKHFFYF